MNRSLWLNRGTLSGLLVGMCVGAGSALLWNERSKPAPVPASEAPELATRTKEAESWEQRTQVAKLGCRGLAQAIEAYTNNPANADNDRPRTLTDLVNPPFGGPSFLRNKERDLRDPWGQPYEMQRRKRKDHTEYTLVRTVAPDGTPISQFGIGAESFLPKDDTAK